MINLIILSHRGYWLQTEEKNSRKAFERSFFMGFGTETDIRYDLSALDSAKGKFHGNSYVDFNYWSWLYSLLDLHDIESKNINIENIKMGDIFNKNSSVKSYY